MTSESKATGSTSCTTPPADGPQGPVGPQGPQGPQGQRGAAGKNGSNGTNGVDGKNGIDGKNGVNGKDGVNSTVTLRGASIRHLQIRKISGMKFLSAKATMGGKRLSVKGRTVKVDLRGKSWASTGCVITAKYQANGKVYKVRSSRSLSIIRK